MILRVKKYKEQLNLINVPTIYCEPIYSNTVYMHLIRASEKYPPPE